MARLPVDAPMPRVLKGFQDLGFKLVRKGNHIGMIRESPDGPTTPLTLPSHRRITGSTLRTTLRQSQIQRDEFLAVSTDQEWVAAQMPRRTTYVTDAPSGEDRLGLSDFMPALSRILTDAPRPLTAGVFGPLGNGKMTLAAASLRTVWLNASAAIEDAMADRQVEEEVVDVEASRRRPDAEEAFLVEVEVQIREKKGALKQVGGNVVRDRLERAKHALEQHAGLRPGGETGASGGASGADMTDWNQRLSMQIPREKLE